MGTTLTGTTPQDTYDSLIKVTDNGPLSGTLKALSDGLGNDSSLSLSTTAASLSGTLSVTGNVGIGVTPNTWSGGKALQASSAAVWGFNNNAHLLANAYYDSTFKYIATAAAALYEENLGQHIWYNAPSGSANATITFAERMRITSAGNVGIGTSNPEGKLEIVGGTSTTNTIVVGDTDNATIASDHSIVFNVDRNLAVGGRVVEFRYGGNGYGGGTSVAKFTSAGLCFGTDTAAANALDDYEEGTWTMGVSFGGASVGATYVLTQGTYTKIGRQVTVNGFLVLSSKGSSTGNAAITGLPFAVGIATGNYSAASLAYITNITFADTLQGYPESGQTQITLVETTNAGVRTNLTDADFADNSEVMISFTYFV